MSTYTYDETAIGDSSTDYISFVRFQIDDTNTTNADLSDEVITALYDETLPYNDGISVQTSQISRNYQTAIKAAEYLYRKYSKLASFSADGVSIQYKERADMWLRIVNTLRVTWMNFSGVNSVIYTNRRASFMEC